MNVGAFARTKADLETFDTNQTISETIIDNSTIGVGTKNEHLFVYQSPDLDPNFPPLVDELKILINNELDNGLTPSRDKTCRGKQQVIYFGKSWKQGSTIINDANGNFAHPELYLKLQQLPIWKYITKFLQEKYVQQYEMLMQLPSELHIFGLYPYLIINFNHLCEQHSDGRDSEFINSCIIPFGKY